MREKPCFISITLYGEIKDDPKIWGNWYAACLDLFSNLGYKANYFAVSSEEYNSGRILTIKRSESNLRKIFEDNQKIFLLELYSLPSEFKQAAFDYEILVTRNKLSDPHHITLSMRKKLFNKIRKINPIIDILKRFIDFKCGQIYELSGDEHPIIYAGKSNPISYYKTLKILSQF